MFLAWGLKNGEGLVQPSTPAPYNWPDDFRIPHKVNHFLVESRVSQLKLVTFNHQILDLGGIWRWDQIGFFFFKYFSIVFHCLTL